MDKQTLFTSSEQSKITFESSDDGMYLVGYAVVWNVLSSDRGGFKVRILPNSHVKPSDRDVKALYSHDGAAIVGREKNNTLKLESDDYGLKVRIKLPDTQFGRDLAYLIDKGYIDGMSFGAYPQIVNRTTEGGEEIEEYERFVMSEVTITADPAFTQTTIVVAQGKAFENKNEDGDGEGLTPSFVERDKEEVKFKTLFLD